MIRLSSGGERKARRSAASARRLGRTEVAGPTTAAASACAPRTRTPRTLRTGEARDEDEQRPFCCVHNLSCARHTIPHCFCSSCCSPLLESLRRRPVTTPGSATRRSHARVSRPSACRYRAPSSLRTRAASCLTPLRSELADAVARMTGTRPTVQAALPRRRRVHRVHAGRGATKVAAVRAGLHRHRWLLARLRPDSIRPRHRHRRRRRARRGLRRLRARARDDAWRRSDDARIGPRRRRRRSAGSTSGTTWMDRSSAATAAAPCSSRTTTSSRT